MNIPESILNTADRATEWLLRLPPDPFGLLPNGVAIRWTGGDGNAATHYSLVVCYAWNAPVTDAELRVMLPFVPMDLRIEVRTGRRFRPLQAGGPPAQAGLSVGTDFAGANGGTTSGTLGAIVARAGHPGDKFMLSANHVIALNQVPNPSHPHSIVQPARSANVIARVDELPAACALHGSRNAGDYALARLVDSNAFQANLPAGMPALQRIAPLRATDAVGQAVFKYGAATQMRKGVLRVFKGTFSMNYPEMGLSFGFVDQLAVDDIPGEPTFSAPGDSGSLVVTSSGQPVGLAFADGPLSTMVCPLDSLFTTTGLSFV